MSRLAPLVVLLAGLGCGDSFMARDIVSESITSDGMFLSLGDGELGPRSTFAGNTIGHSTTDLSTSFVRVDLSVEGGSADNPEAGGTAVHLECDHFLGDPIPAPVTRGQPTNEPIGPGTFELRDYCNAVLEVGLVWKEHDLSALVGTIRIDRWENMDHQTAEEGSSAFVDMTFDVPRQEIRDILGTEPAVETIELKGLRVRGEYRWIRIERDFLAW